MKENKYDDDAFFAAYSGFPRSVEGLCAAGEWHELKKLLPDFNSRRVLDIGCGLGWHCAYAAEHGAARVLGIDISEKMLSAAREKNSRANVEYRRVAMEDMDFAPGSFDVAISSLAFHYTPDFAAICRSVSRLLAADGDFVFSAEHPVFTARAPQEWIYGEDGERLHWPVDGYFCEGARKAVFLGSEIIKYHRTVATYVCALLETGFEITALVEPQPTPGAIEAEPAMRDELRRPMMLLVAAKKRGA